MLNKLINIEIIIEGIAVIVWVIFEIIHVAIWFCISERLILSEVNIGRPDILSRKEVKNPEFISEII